MVIELKTTADELADHLALAESLGVDELLTLWHTPIDQRLALWVSLL